MTPLKWRVVSDAEVAVVRVDAGRLTAAPIGRCQCNKPMSSERQASTGIADKPAGANQPGGACPVQQWWPISLQPMALTHSADHRLQLSDQVIVCWLRCCGTVLPM